MSKYSEAAILAIKYLEDKIVDSPEKAWVKACKEKFPGSPDSQKKGCPKNTFLALCEEGYILGIPKGNYLHKHNSVEKDYAIKALKILKNEPNNNFTSNILWRKIMEGTVKHHDYQMEVVLGLWKNKNLNV